MLSERSPPYPGSPTSADFALVGVDLANASRSTPIVEPSSIAGIGILRLLAPLVAQDDRRGERRGLAQDDRRGERRGLAQDDRRGERRGLAQDDRRGERRGLAQADRRGERRGLAQDDTPRK